MRAVDQLAKRLGAVRSRVERGRLHHVYSAVMPSNLLTRRGSIMAGDPRLPATVASNRAAAALFELRLAQRG